MKSVSDKNIKNQQIGNVGKNESANNYFLSFFCFGVRMSWNIADTRNLSLKLKSKLGLCQVKLTFLKTSPEKSR